jgi:ribonuclease Z
MHFSVTILGSGSATPTLGRHPTAQLLTYENECFLLDCGEGTQYRLIEQKVRPSKLKHIFISHLHGDHYFGLIGLLSTLNLSGRTEEMHIYGPRGLADMLLLPQKYAESPFLFPIQFTEIDTTRSYQVFENQYLTVMTIPMQHRIPCAGFLFREKKRKRNIIKEKMPEGISYEQIHQLKDGKDIMDERGNVQFANDAYTVAAPDPRAYAFCSDTRYEASIAAVVRGVDLLYHEATFMEDLSVQASERFHATARQAGLTAQQADAKKLLIGHFSSRYKSFEAFRDEARAVFANTELAEEGTQFVIEEITRHDSDHYAQ